MTEGSAVYYPSRMNGSGAPFGLALACCCYLRFVVLVLFGNVDVDVVSRFRVFVRVVLGPYDIPKKYINLCEVRASTKFYGYKNF